VCVHSHLFSRTLLTLSCPSDIKPLVKKAWKSIAAGAGGGKKKVRLSLFHFFCGVSDHA
jgi:hypothetical protein